METRSHTLSVRSLFSLPLASILSLSIHAHGITITSGPSFTNASSAPLVGVLQLTTDVPSRVSVSVDDGTNTWTHDFLDYATNHSQTLLGFKPHRTNAITVTVRDLYRNGFTAAQPLTFITAPLPANFPVINVLISQTNKMEPGYTLFRGANNNGGVGYVTFVDNTGQVVWYSSAIPTYLDVRQLDNGDLFVPNTSYAEESGPGIAAVIGDGQSSRISIELDTHDDRIASQYRLADRHDLLRGVNHARRIIRSGKTLYERWDATAWH